MKPYQVIMMITKYQIELVFVHLGSVRADHLVLNIKLLKDMFPYIKINCVISEISSIKEQLPDFVEVFIYKPLPEIDDLFSKNRNDLRFRQGFWRYTLERLIAINTFHVTRPTVSLLHIESDILLMASFPFSQFLQLKKVYWLPATATSDIASLIYLPSMDHTKEFTQDIVKYINNSKLPTDMHALKNLRKNYSSRYELLPYSNINLPRLSSADPDYSRDDNSQFTGIFDGSAIGMWLTGIDPRNYYGYQVHFSSKSFSQNKFLIDPSMYNMNYDLNNGLYFTTDTGQKIQVYNLHIHSKSKIFFSPGRHLAIQKLIVRSHNHKIYKSFNLGVFGLLIKQNFKEKSLVPFLYHSPLFYFVRKFHRFLTGM